ncbi:MAG: dihydrolipoamide acetyltransferase family protein, partial [Rhodospirillaceae bacterium]
MTRFVMPSLGADMESGTLIEWLKQPGDKVHRGDVVAVVETQKGAIEIEIFQDGAIARLLVQPGTKVPVGAPLAEIDAGAAKDAAAVTPVPAPPVTPMPAPPAVPLPAKEQRPIPPAPTAGIPMASPAARKFAAEHGVDLAGVAGSGPGNAIVFVDVEHAAAAARAPQHPGVTGPAPTTGRPDLGEMRKAIAAAMSRSKREIPHYYLAHTFDLSAAQRWLEQTNAGRDPAQRILLGVLLVKATAHALRGMPDFNGHFIDGAYRPSTPVHVGMAIAVRGGGLIAPAIHDADRLSLDEIMAKLRDLTARVRSGRLRGSEIADPTITISSLGDRGVDALHGIIHPPQVALVGFGKPQNRPWAVSGGVGLATVMTVTL